MKEQCFSARFWKEIVTTEYWHSWWCTEGDAIYVVPLPLNSHYKSSVTCTLGVMLDPRCSGKASRQSVCTQLFQRES